jgi:hypothetical protein
MTAESRNNGTRRAMNQHATIKEMVEVVFSVWSSPKLYNEDLREIRSLNLMVAILTAVQVTKLPL